MFLRPLAMSNSIVSKFPLNAIDKMNTWRLLTPPCDRMWWNLRMVYMMLPFIACFPNKIEKVTLKKQNT